ncbi:MAG: hypothetical protein ACPL6D_14850 [Thermodesulfobacteriota bacterium]
MGEIAERILKKLNAKIEEETLKEEECHEKGIESPSRQSQIRLYRASQNEKKDNLDTYLRLIDEILKKVNNAWIPGTLNKVDPITILKMKKLEAEINFAVFNRNLDQLKEALSRYEKWLLSLIEFYDA